MSEDDCEKVMDSSETIEYVRVSPEDYLKKEKKRKAVRRVKIFGYLALFIGIAMLVEAYYMDYLSNRYLEYGAATIVSIYHGLICAAICALLFIIIIVHKIVYKVKISKAVVLSLIGFILTFSFFLVAMLGEILDSANPHIAKEKMIKNYRSCEDTYSRAKDFRLKKPTDKDVLSQKDVLCAYLEAFYRTGKEPQTIEEIMPWVQSDVVKTGKVKITIDGEQPSDLYTWNIIPQYTCIYKERSDDSYVSIWYRSGDNKEMGCISITPYSYSIYDMKHLKLWYEEQFDV